MTPSVYFAGPDVFRPDAIENGRRLCAMARAAGLAGLYPLDAAIPEHESMAGTANAIFRANVAMIDCATAVIANISPFRGPNMDPGTAFEIGYAIARGKPVFAWSCDPRSLAERTRRWTAERAETRLRLHGAGDGRIPDPTRDLSGYAIEDFGLEENLMIACPVQAVYRGAEDAIKAAARMLLAAPAEPMLAAAQ